MDGRAIDLLSCPASRSYFETREHQWFYNALKKTESRRDFHPKLIGVATQFLELTADPQNETIVDEVIARSVERGGRAESTAQGAIGAYASAIRRLQPRGWHLLGLEELKWPPTPDMLKKNYRAAAQKHHPDHGGTHDDMVSINQAFEATYDLLLSAAGLDDMLATNSQQQTCRDYQYVIGLLLFTVHLDDWAADEAFRYLIMTESQNWQASNFMRDARRQSGLCLECAKLAIRLSLAGRREDAEVSLRVTRVEAEALKSPSWDLLLADAETVIQGKRRPHVILNHRRQLENAWRLKMIDKRKYEAALAKLTSRADAREGRDVAALDLLSAYQAEVGFLCGLPSDVICNGKIVRALLVPEPGYFKESIACLTDDQQAEYQATFQRGGPLGQVRKYFFVRLQSLLDTSISHEAETRVSDLEREARFLSTLFDSHSPQHYATATADALQFLASLPHKELAQRLCLLRAIRSLPSTDLNSFANFLGMIPRPLIELEPILGNEGRDRKVWKARGG
jgi:hypothetical protein